jgi:hypothetical protein
MMELLGDMGRVESHIGPFGDGVNVRLDRSTVCAECTIRLGYHFGYT